MKLWPSSLRARLMLVMAIGLLFALVSSNLVYWHERGQFARQVRLDYHLQRVAAAVRLLDEADERSREDILKVIKTRMLMVRILPDFPPSKFNKDTQDTIVNNAMARRVYANLQAQLGKRPMLFQVVSDISANRFPQNRRHDHDNIHPRVGFLTVVGLEDGAAAEFRFRIPKEASKWRLELIASTAVLLLAAILLSALAVRLVMRPLRDVADQAGQIGIDLNTPLMSESGPSEVRQLSRAMNTMQTRIRDLFEQRSRFLAAISHDLRTPITRLRLRVEMVEDTELKERLQRDLVEMEAMVQETLEYMRDDASREPLLRIDITALLEAIVDDLLEQGMKVQFDPGDRLVVSSRPRALKRCIENLLFNALRYGKQVELKVESDVEFVHIRIIDDGPGIPDDEIERVFEPFYRLDRARSRAGSGLGLSISRMVIESLGGSVRLNNRESGGLEVNVKLPVSPSIAAPDERPL
ncbi:MAG: two-component sensor histidine kinase [marine bacterium B5-7]|nr:MAG: two-component sensor histidine kinase [marine bacterium B5-7]